MKPKRMILIFIIICILFFHIQTSFAKKPAEALKNEQYELTLLEDSSIQVNVADVSPQILTGEFTVMYSAKNPGFHKNHRNYRLAPRSATRWPNYNENLDSLNKQLKTQEMINLLRAEVTVSEDEKGWRTWTYKNSTGEVIRTIDDRYAQGTINPYLAGIRTILSPVDAFVDDSKSIIWKFDSQPNFELTAKIILPAGKADPQITYHLKVKEEGYYSVAFTGTPWVDKNKAIRVPQPQEIASREYNFVMSEAYATLPRVHTATEYLNSVLVADPKESPFRLIEDSRGVWTYAAEDESNSRFGLMIEKQNERLRPVIFTPIMGGYQSRMKSGDTYTFTLHYLLKAGDWINTYKYIAREIYNFRDLRDNSGPGSLNKTLENIIDYLIDRSGHNYAMWHTEQKYYNYWSDKSGVFKPFSPMFGLAAAIVTDDEEFYFKRALPAVEFALSRKGNVFLPYDVIETGHTRYSATRNLGFPYPNTVQLVSLGKMFQNRTYAFDYYSWKKGFDEKNAMHALARYRLTGDKKFLDTAMMKKTGGFMDLLEVYEETGDQNYLDAAVKSAYRYIPTCNLFPAVPDSMVTVDKGNKAPIHGHAYGRHKAWGFPPPKPLYTPEQTVQAWRVSLVGVELSAYRGGYWINNHGQLMRLATHARDDFMRDMQRWALVGRFANYPGDFRSNRHSLVEELPDAPMHYIYETDFSTFNPGHAWEWVGAVMDFLISDCFNRSKGKIDFPSQCMYGSSFRVKVYGDRPGKFYDEDNVRLWLPRKLLTPDNKQVDYLAGYGNGKFYVAFWNQSFEEETVNITFNREFVDCRGEHSARFWKNNTDKGIVSISDNTLQFSIPAKGIMAYAIDDVKVKTNLHAKMFDETARALGKNSIVTDVDTPFGKLHAMLLSMGKGLTTSYVYTDALPENVIVATLKYRQEGDQWQELKDEIFPFEFTTPIDEDQGDFEFIFEIENAEQKIQESEKITLKL